MKSQLSGSASILGAVFALALAPLTGCSSNWTAPASDVFGSSVSDAGGGDAGGAIDEAAPADAAPVSDGSSGADTSTDTGAEPASDETGANGGAQAGTLTAGSFDDNLNFEVFQDFIGEVQQSDAAGDFPNLSLGQRVIVTVKDQQGTAIPDARVVVTAEGQQAPLLDQTTGTDGRVLFLTGLDGGSGVTSFALSVTPPGSADAVADVRDLNDPQWDVTLATAGAPVGKLDLAFVMDATGSMSDELEYLKTEVRSIAQSVSGLFPQVAQRYALIVYRDEGDVYVVRSFDFTASLDEFTTNLEDQSADAGGDWPEAVHLALEAADQLSWADSDTARVMFWIADAPPHTEFAERTLVS
jgi:hypothetical protein